MAERSFTDGVESVDTEDAPDSVDKRHGDRLALKGRSAHLMSVVVSAVFIAFVLTIALSYPTDNGGDASLDWLAVKGAVDGRVPGATVGELADLYEVDLGPEAVNMVSDEEWLHPRSPGSLLLLLPMAALSNESTIVVSRAITALCWIVVCLLIVPRIARRPVYRVVPWLIAAVATAPVLMLFEFGSHLAFVTLALGTAWLLLRRGDSLWAGLLIGCSAVLRITFGVALLPLILAGRRRALGAAGLAFVVLEIGGLLILGIEPAALIGEMRAATDQWLEVGLNGSLPATFVRLGVSTQVAVPLTAAVVGSVFVLVGRFRRERDLLDDWIAVSIGGGLLLSPVLWEQYLVVLVLPLAWHLSTAPPRSRGAIVLAIASTQLALLFARVELRSESLRGLILALCTVLLVGLIAFMVGNYRKPRSPELSATGLLR